MNPFEMVVLIVAITAVASVVRARYGLTGRKDRQQGFNPQDAARSGAEAEALRHELRSLKERVAVLERLATDGNSSLEREFEMLKRQEAETRSR
ncbi:MAG: hypothetical protein ABW184_03375 [Sphingobium sp.]